MEKREIVFLNSIFFVIGFVVVFSIVGIALQLLISSTASALMQAFRIIGGVVIFAFGIILLISTRRFIPFFSGEYKLHFMKLNSSFASSFIFGIAFAIGWTPCVGPILGSIYALAATSPGISFLLLLAYSFGLGIPFIIAGAFMSKFTDFIRKARGALKYVNFISGVFLIAIGLLLITGYIGYLSVFLVSGGGSGGYISLNGSLNFLIAIAAGILTFLSPCILPLVPAYFSYIGGATIDSGKA